MGVSILTLLLGIVVILAIILDRLTQSFAQRSRQRTAITTRLKQFFARGEGARSN